MPRTERYRIVFASETLGHIDSIERKYHRLIERAIDEHLTFNPDRPTRNRKPLEAPSDTGVTWELRCGPTNRFRVFYEIQSAERTVWILAIGVKDRNRLSIGGEEIQL
jgi:mRNA-degrading endonuclease RelE of RelBE toxin-antitoxin system